MHFKIYVPLLIFLFVSLVFSLVVVIKYVQGELTHGLHGNPFEILKDSWNQTFQKKFATSQCQVLRFMVIENIGHHQANILHLKPKRQYRKTLKASIFTYKSSFINKGLLLRKCAFLLMLRQFDDI